MTAINLVYFNVLHIFPNFINFNNLCLGPLPFLFVFKDLRHIIVAMLVTLYPLSICEKAHLPLPPSLTLENINFLLIEEKFFIIFYKFLLNLEENKGKAQGTLFFYIYLSILPYVYIFIIFILLYLQISNV